MRTYDDTEVAAIFQRTLEGYGFFGSRMGFASIELFDEDSRRWGIVNLTEHWVTYATVEEPGDILTFPAGLVRSIEWDYYTPRRIDPHLRLS